MNRHLRRTFYLFACCFVALVGMLAYWQVYARESLANNPDNGLQTRREIEAPRGFIYAADGETVLAESQEQPADVEGGNPTYSRVYPQGPLYAGIVGYWSTRYGATGIEIAENANLSGTADPSTLDELINQVSGGPQPGNNVTLTIDNELQQVAYDALASSSTQRGSIVAVNPKTGELLAMASYPSYDPNGIDEEGRFEELLEDENSPLLNRATQGLYPPGSVFKVVTAAAALQNGVSPQDMYTDNGTYEQPGYTVVNYDDGVYGEVNFATALALSINTIFAQVAVEEIGYDNLLEVARNFGYADNYDDFILPINQSVLGEGNVAQISFGQDTNLSNVFEMAMVTGAIANDGVMMQPRLIKEVRSPDGVIIDRPQPVEKQQAIDPETADTLQDMMVGVVEEGTSTAAQRPGIQVAGKTGTAEVPPNAPHSWFIVSAPADDPEIAVAAMVENGGDGETQGLPAAMKVVDAALDIEGQGEQQPTGESIFEQDIPTDPEGIPQTLPEDLPQGLPPEVQQGIEQFFQQN